MFKKTTNTFLASLLTFFSCIVLHSCSSDGSSGAIFGSSKSPQEITIAFLENEDKGKIEAAKAYATESSGMLLDFSAKMGALDINPNASYSIMSDSIVGKQGLVQVKNNNKEKSKGTWYAVVMVDDEWKVDLDKTVKRQKKQRSARKAAIKKQQRKAEQRVNDKLFKVN